jgi:hypothetical protein
MVLPKGGRVGRCQSFLEFHTLYGTLFFCEFNE